MTPNHIARKIARKIEALEGISHSAPYAPRVRNATEAREHGWMPKALATVTYEGGIDLIDLIGNEDFGAGSPYYVEAYSTYMVGVYKR